MSRLGHLKRGVASSYLQLAATAAFALASVPLALSRLSKAEYGVWGLVLELTGLLVVLDLGLSASFARLLIDEKDRKEVGRYDRLLNAAWWFFGLQALAVLVAAAALAGPFVVALRIPPELRGPFTAVLLAQAAVAAGSCLTRVPAVVLLSHHRMDLGNLASAAAQVANLGALWFGLRAGWGLPALAFGAGCALAVNALLLLLGCRRQRLALRPGRWHRPAWADLRELLHYGANVMLVNVGVQLIFFSRTTVVTAAMGLEAAGIWTACTRPFSLLYQACWKPADMAFGLFSEMVARGEQARLRETFGAVFRTTLALAAAAGVAYAAGAGAFVAWWTQGRVGWTWTCDALLAVWLLPLTAARLTNWLVQATKRVGWLPWVYLGEGAAMFVLGWLGGRWLGFPGVIAASLLCTVLISAGHGLAAAAARLGDGPRALLPALLRPAASLAAGLAGAAAVQRLVPAGGLGGLLAAGALGAALAAAVFFGIGLARADRARLRAALARRGQPAAVQ